jgi:hypothetical protein
MSSSSDQLAFVCVGPQRTATSWLHQQLRRHSRLAFPLHVKETMFFDQRYEKGMDWYWRHFASTTGDCKRGEVAPTYFDSGDAVKRLLVFKNLRIIISIRDPIERTYSLFRHHRAQGRVAGDYFAAVKMMPQIESASRYATHCPRWESNFGHENCLYVFQAEIEQEPQAAMDKVCSFLAVDPIGLSQDGKRPFGQATQPKSQLTATIAARFSSALRSRGLHGPIEAAKRLGLRTVVFGKPAGTETMPEAVREHLEMIYAQDVVYLNSRFGEQAWR